MKFFFQLFFLLVLSGNVDQNSVIAFHSGASPGGVGVTSASTSTSTTMPLATRSSQWRLLKYHQTSKISRKRKKLICLSLKQFHQRQQIITSLHFALPGDYDQENNNEPSSHYNHHRRVAILLPESVFSDSQSNHDGDDTTQRQHLDAMRHLEKVATEYGLPLLHDNDIRSTSEEPYSHYLTAVPYPRTNTYALAIHAVSQSSNNNNNNSRRNSRKKKMTKLVLDPVFVDLCPPSDTQLGYRVNKKGDGGGGELLIKALGGKKILSEKDTPLIIYDLTAGLARDSLVILSSFLANNDGGNLRLHMVERDPMVALLLMDAMRRLNLLADGATDDDAAATSSNHVTEKDSNTARQISQCLSMEEGDGVSVLHRLVSKNTISNLSGGSSSNNAPIMASSPVPSYPPDICYLDPMFPPRKKKSSAVKKDMAMLHSLLGTADAKPNDKHHDQDSDAALASAEPSPLSPSTIIASEATTRMKEEQDLLLAAYNVATRRVVVKRPIGAQPLGCFLPGSSDGDEEVDRENNNDREDIGHNVDFPKPSYDVRGSVNRFDVYVIS